MVPMFLFRSAGRSASLLSRFQCRTTNLGGIATSSSRYLTSSSSGNGNSNNPSEGSKTSLVDLAIGSKDNSTDGATKTAPLVSAVDSVKAQGPPLQSPPLPTVAESVYVHPLSQIVLQLLQNECHEWITRKGLDRNLTVHRDGTFSLETTRTRANSNGANMDTNTNNLSASARIWTTYDPEEKQHWLIYSSSTGDDHSIFSAASDQNPATAATSTNVRHKFLMQDNLRTAWQKGTKNTSVPDLIREAVRELMFKVR
jgi:hypothetical protein